MATSNLEGQALFNALAARPELQRLKEHIAKGTAVDPNTPVYDTAQTALNALLATFNLKPLWTTT